LERNSANNVNKGADMDDPQSGLTIWQVDAFTDQPFAGNPAAVVVLEKAADAGWMQKVGREMNLSETAFLHPENDGWRLRWFTPKVEVALCGHATLAAAHVLFEEGFLAADQPAAFQTLSGPLTVRLKDDGFLQMDFPTKPVAAVQPPAGLLEALGLDARFVGKSEYDYLVEARRAEAVLELEPDCSLLKQVECRGVIVTSRAAGQEYDFISRFFAPAAGVDEDPVTGSAHASLAPYWQAKMMKDELVAYQASERGGILHLKVDGRRVLIAGRAVTVMKGRFFA
jgi:PhzF family phenazine biosynthesis protein